MSLNIYTQEREGSAGGARTWMFDKLLAFEERVEDEARVGEILRGDARGGGHRARVWRAGHAQGRDEDIVVGAVGAAVGVLHALSDRRCSRGRATGEGQVPARGMRQVLVH